MAAMKPSSGNLTATGSTALAYEDGHYTVNGEEATGGADRPTIAQQKSFYVITEYVVMHPPCSGPSIPSLSTPSA